MARVTQQRSARQHGAAGPIRGAQVSKQRKRQKVVLESDSKGNKLRSVVRSRVSTSTARGLTYPLPQISFQAEPPPGYTFIPAGNPQLTTELKELSRKENRKIHQVSVRNPQGLRRRLSNPGRQPPTPQNTNCPEKFIELDIIFLLISSPRYAPFLVFA
jgi:hypothetical protein